MVSGKAPQSSIVGARRVPRLCRSFFLPVYGPSQYGAFPRSLNDCSQALTLPSRDDAIASHSAVRTSTTGPPASRAAGASNAAGPSPSSAASSWKPRHGVEEEHEEHEGEPLLEVAATLRGLSSATGAPPLDRFTSPAAGAVVRDAARTPRHARGIRALGRAVVVTARHARGSSEGRLWKLAAPVLSHARHVAPRGVGEGLVGTLISGGAAAGSPKTLCSAARGLSRARHASILPTRSQSWPMRSSMRASKRA